MLSQRSATECPGARGRNNPSGLAAPTPRRGAISHPPRRAMGSASPIARTSPGSLGKPRQCRFTMSNSPEIGDIGCVQIEFNSAPYM